MSAVPLRFSVLLVGLALTSPLFAVADFEIVPSLAAEHAGATVIEDVSFDGSQMSVVNGADLTGVNNEWNVQFLVPPASGVSGDRSAYILARVANYDDFRVEIPYSLVHAPIPGDDGDEGTIESQAVSFDLPPLGDPDVQSGFYSLIVYSYPDTKSVCQDVEPFNCFDEPYTEQNFLDWFHWQYEVDYSTFEGDVPITYSPAGSRALVFEYVAGEAPNVCASDCFSNVLFIPGIKGSVLVHGTDTLWPPTVFSNDVPQLALTESGESVNDMYVAGIVNTFYGTPIYGPFSDFLDDLVADGVINSWSPFAYDWRFLPETILDEGIKTENGTIDVIEHIENLAAQSKSGKISIVAHSMGGLVGKAIIKRLQEEGKDDLIDSFVMVGSPQLGTPQAIAAMLHGDSEGIAAGFIVNPAAARTLSENMPSAYSLLPSQEYFATVLDPVVTFDDVGFTDTWRAFWGDSLNAFGPYVEFLTGLGVPREEPDPNTLRIPTALRGDLVSAAQDFHTEFDTYAFPEHIRVVQVAGWGRPTTKAVRYTTNHFLQNYETVFTREGDSTVVYPSAISSGDGEEYFFNLFDYNDFSGDDAQHRDLLNVDLLQNIVKEVVKGETITLNNFTSTTKPVLDDLEDQLLISTHSPVILGAYDSLGRFTGITPNQDLSAEILAIQEDIPGSSFVYTNEAQHIFVPKEGTYTFVYQGTGSGPTTVSIGNFSADAIAPVAQFSEIPTTPNTTATFDIMSETPEETVIEVDVDGDTVVDETVHADGTVPSLTELIALIKEKILALDIKEKLKQNLLKEIANLEKKVEAKKQKNAKILANFKEEISNQALKGKIAAASADEIIALLELLESQSDAVALDAGILTQLKDKIISLNIKVALKNDLLKRVNRLENKKVLIDTLANLTTTITKKATSGKLSDADAQVLIDLLGQIESAI